MGDVGTRIAWQSSGHKRDRASASRGSLSSLGSFSSTGSAGLSSQRARQMRRTDITEPAQCPRDKWTGRLPKAAHRSPMNTGMTVHRCSGVYQAAIAKPYQPGLKKLGTLPSGEKQVDQLLSALQTNKSKAAIHAFLQANATLEDRKGVFLSSRQIQRLDAKVRRLRSPMKSKVEKTIVGNRWKTVVCKTTVRKSKKQCAQDNRRADTIQFLLDHANIELN